MQPRQILHCDCNCFYAAVEAQEHPEYRGKQIAVCGDPQARHGIVLTASYPAKRQGVKTGDGNMQAQQRCRDLIIIPPHYSEYVRYSGFVREIFEQYTDQVEPFGLDESWLDVTGSCGLFGNGMSIAKDISRKVKKELGITVSIGVANNKISAKLGSDYKKPDAITRIEADNYEEIAYPLPVEDLLYVGQLPRRNFIGTVSEQSEIWQKQIPTYWRDGSAKWGIFFPVLPAAPIKLRFAKQGWHAAVKSIGNSATTPRDLLNDKDVWLMLVILSESIASRMRELAMKCTVVEITVRDKDLCSFIRQRKLETPTCYSMEIAQAAFALFKSSYSWTKPLRSIGVRGSNLVSADSAIQLSLLSNEENRERHERLDRAVDVIRERYGYTSLQRAIVYTDHKLGRVNPTEHTIHPVGYFCSG